MKPAIISICVITILAGLAFFIFKNPPLLPLETEMQTTPNSAFQTTPLHTASEQGDLEACKQLIADGADINAYNQYGWSPLILAVQHNHVDTARLLLKAGASMHYTYQREDTPEERSKQKQEQE